ncbi:trypsin-like peptidase domain-containing protein [Rhizobium leguminosarum]|uniref:trypsin-like peptidase domain-containing protein n=1 Tax=Rhizobium leguminosarum TaxID=384 RepID=UPI00067F640A|nr:trypsin-like peptidase domain-containing protein [Rhizobium leguminosarum]MBY5416967.1 trypsin-like peptidase domain-containing protein [Rhizobium leguminosarum]
MAIYEESLKSLFLEMSFNGTLLSTGTGFLCTSPIGPVLITNRHNVTGRRQDTGQAISSHGGVPDKISIRHNRLGHAGETLLKDEALFDHEGERRWIEHPTLGAMADFVALPLSNTYGGIQLRYYDPSDPGPLFKIGPTAIVSVLGFPFGITGGASLAVWATGFVASEPDADYGGLPTFLIDCRTRPGQSGSPVIAYRHGMADMEGGGTLMSDRSLTRFLGIYSGRVNADADLGIVWKARVIAELIASLKQ